MGGRALRTRAGMQSHISYLPKMYATSPKTTTVHFYSCKSGVRDKPTVAIELGGVKLEGVLVDSGSTMQCH